ncbi:Uncharacterised protein [uncultured archaeon]|nr:Uncharacterised protein [uncultured archaeon]
MFGVKRHILILRPKETDEFERVLRSRFAVTVAKSLEELGGTELKDVDAAILDISLPEKRGDVGGSRLKVSGAAVKAAQTLMESHTPFFAFGVGRLSNGEVASLGGDYVQMNLDDPNTVSYKLWKLIEKRRQKV